MNIWYLYPTQLSDFQSTTFSCKFSFDVVYHLAQEQDKKFCGLWISHLQCALKIKQSQKAAPALNRTKQDQTGLNRIDEDGFWENRRQQKRSTEGCACTGAALKIPQCTLENTPVYDNIFLNRKFQNKVSSYFWASDALATFPTEEISSHQSWGANDPQTLCSDYFDVSSWDIFFRIPALFALFVTSICPSLSQPSWLLGVMSLVTTHNQVRY